MQVSICDICQVVIKPNGKKYVVLLHEIKEGEMKIFNDAFEAIQAANRRYNDIIIREICEECKKIYNNVFQMRIEEVEKMKKEIEESYNLKWGKKK